MAECEKILQKGSGSVTLSIISVLVATTLPQAQPRRSTTCKASSGSRLSRYGRAASLPETSVNNRITESYCEGARGGGGPDFSVSALWVHLGVTIGLCTNRCTLIPWSGYHAAVPRLGGLSIPFPRRPSLPRCLRRPSTPRTCASHTLRTPAFPCANPQGIVQTLFLSRPSLSPHFLCLLSRSLPAFFLTCNKYFLSTKQNSRLCAGGAGRTLAPGEFTVCWWMETSRAAITLQIRFLCLPRQAFHVLPDSATLSTPHLAQSLLILILYFLSALPGHLRYIFVGPKEKLKEGEL